ncbi:CE1759 family FMN reductase [Rothia nasimurium]|uniref:CE1759 family FMN reductase n=1 Tax=Rothia nasimurium TaxID=85336 RepID=UPI001F01C0C1|nr:CE1759 family FMN reductase [Rothia nasimurium]
MSTPSIVVVTAGLGEPSTTALLGENLSEATGQALGRAGVEANFTHISLRSLAKDITNHYLTGFPLGALATALDQVRDADAIIAVTPVFKASYSGLFKSFWDLVEDGSLAGKPVLIAATGGTARHSLVLETAMRPLFSYLKATVAPSGVFAATDDFGSDTNLAPRVAKAAAEFAQMILWARNLPGMSGQDAGTPGQAGQASELGSAQEAPEPQDSQNPANAGFFFGTLEGSSSSHASPETYKAPGLKALQVTPFEQLLREAGQ